MINDDFYRAAICAQLHNLGWTIRQAGPSVAIKTYQTAVGQKDAFAYLSDADNEELRLSGEYYSKGNNILSTFNVYIPKISDVQKIHDMTKQFSDNVELIIKDSYAARLLALSELESQQDNLNQATEVHMSTKYGYYINLDERGEFFADVRDSDDNSIFEINGFDIFEDGFMRNKNDIDGLQEMLIDMKIIDSGAVVLSSDEFDRLSDENGSGVTLS